LDLGEHHRIRALYRPEQAEGTRRGARPLRPRRAQFICVTNFVFRYPSKVSVPPSLPQPLSFRPPNGVSASAMPKWLMLMLPASMPVAAACAFFSEVVNT